MKIFNIGNRIVNIYLIKHNTGYILIDTGYNENYNSFLKGLDRIGVRPREIEYIFLTHAHDDHVGFLNELLDISEVKVILHAKAVERLKEGRNRFDGGCSGVLAFSFCRLMALLGKGQHKFNPVNREERYIILDKESIYNIESELCCKIVPLPGHTEDSIGILFKNGDFFCGDAAMNGFPSTNKVTIWIENIKDFEKSWNEIIKLNPRTIYPSHGKPFKTFDLIKNKKWIRSKKLYPLNE